MRRLILIAVLPVIVACTAASEETGTLEGQVSIGPLVPVLREGELESTPAPEVYAAREIVIYARNGQTEIIRVPIRPDGTYRVPLPVGTYVVDINHTGIDRGIDLPQTVEILSQQVTRLDVEIDTGIR